MVTKESCIQYILKEIPGFRDMWEEHMKYWEGNSPSLYTDISEFSNYIIELIRSNTTENLTKIFNLLEYLLIHGDADVKNAVSTCCLENIINTASDKKSGVKYYMFVNLLGKKSKEFCKDYDQITGVKTPGLE